MKDMISVVVCTYNQETTIGRALDSILRQRCPWPVEIVVGDDHSTDSTLSVCRDYERRYKGRVRVIAHERNLGVLGNYISCLTSCHGKYIADLAGDDEWADDEKLAMQLAYMESHPNTAIVHTDYLLRDATTGILSMPPRYHLRREPYGGQDFVADMMSRDVRPPVHLCTAMYRNTLFRECLREWPQYFATGRYPCEDIQLTALMAMKGKVAYIDKVTLLYTVGGKSVSHNIDSRSHCLLIKGCVELSADIARTLNITVPGVWRHLGRISAVMLTDAMATGDRGLRDECVDIVRRYGLSIGWRGKAVTAITDSPLLWRLTMSAITFAGNRRRKNHRQEHHPGSLAVHDSPRNITTTTEDGSVTDSTGGTAMRKKILFVIEGLAVRGGLERVMADRMNALAERGHDVVMVDVYDHGDTPDAFTLSPSVKRIRLGIRKRRLWMKPWQFREVVKATRRVVNDEKPDVMTAAALLGVMLYGMGHYATRMIYESHGPRRFMPLKLMVRRMERTVDAVVTLTEADAMEYKIARHKVVIPNYSHLDGSSSVSTGRSRPSGLSGDTGTFGASGTSGCPGNVSLEVVALGRMTTEKDFALLLRAWYIVCRTVPTARLDIYGDGPELKKLEWLAISLGINSHVTFRGSVRDVSAVYRRASFLVMSSRFEGFPMVILEALSHGVAVVSVDAPHGPRELLRGGGGILTERSPQALADAVIRLLTDPDLTRRLSHDAPANARRYSKDTIISMWEKTIARLA